MVHLLVAIPPKDFQDKELEPVLALASKKGWNTTIASTMEGIATGKFGSTQKTVALKDQQPAGYDALVFIGGPGTPLLRADAYALQLAREFAAKGKIVAAICWSPTILAKAGILKGKRATVWVGFDPEYGKTTDAVLTSFGATFVNQPNVVDGTIITANGPPAAVQYAQDIAQLLERQSKS